MTIQQSRRRLCAPISSHAKTGSSVCCTTAALDMCGSGDVIGMLLPEGGQRGGLLQSRAENRRGVIAAVRDDVRASFNELRLEPRVQCRQLAPVRRRIGVMLGVIPDVEHGEV